MINIFIFGVKQVYFVGCLMFLSHIEQVHIFIPYLFKINYCINFPYMLKSPKWQIYFSFSDLKCMQLPSSPCKPHAPLNSSSFT